MLAILSKYSSIFPLLSDSQFNFNLVRYSNKVNILEDKLFFFQFISLFNRKSIRNVKMELDLKSLSDSFCKLLSKKLLLLQALIPI